VCVGVCVAVCVSVCVCVCLRWGKDPCCNVPFLFLHCPRRHLPDVIPTACYEIKESGFLFTFWWCPCVFFFVCVVTTGVAHSLTASFD
jgi:hypothetical protein